MGGVFWKVGTFGESQPAGFPQVAVVVKIPPANSGDKRDMGSIPGLGRSSGGGNGSPFQYSCPWTEKPDDLRTIGSQRGGSNLAAAAAKLSRRNSGRGHYV